MYYKSNTFLTLQDALQAKMHHIKICTQTENGKMKEEKKLML